jgi:hypothetical protein
LAFPFISLICESWSTVRKQEEAADQTNEAGAPSQRAKLREMKKEKSALIAKVHDTSEHFRELELKLSHEQKLVAESRATILEQ